MKADDIFRVLRRIGIARPCIKQTNEWIAAPCPLAPWTHPKGSDRSASFGISIAEEGRSGYNCLSCHEHGNVEGLLNRLEDLSGKDYSDLIAEVSDLEKVVAFPPWESRPKQARQLPEPLDEGEFDELFEPASQVRAARGYFNNRSLLCSSMDRFDLRWDDYHRRILFKAKREGLFYGVSGRAVSETAKRKVKVYEYPAKLFLMGEEHVIDDPDRPTLVIEGLMGLVELDSCNLFDYANAVALQGSVMSVEQRDRLVELGNPVVLLFDDDEAGRRGLNGSRDSKGRRTDGAFSMLRGLIDTKVARLPSGVEDLRYLTERETHDMVMKTAAFNP